MFIESNQHFFPHGLDLPFYESDLFPWQLLDKMQTYFQHLKKNIQVEIPEGVFLKGEEMIVIEKGAIIEPGCYIQGPCYIGKNVQIRHGAYIRGNVWIGENSVIGHATEVKNVIIGSNSSLAHFVYAADSVVGNGVNLASHVTLANLRLDRQKVLPMDLKKFGAVIADGVQIGCHVVLNPGKQLRLNTTVYLKQQLQIENGSVST